MDERDRPHSAWVLTAMLAPMAHSAGVGWFQMALASAVLLPLCLLPGRFEGMKKPVLVLEWISVTLAGTVLLPAAGTCWPGNASTQVVPLVLLVLAALARDRRRSTRVAVMLFWMGAILAVFLCYMGLRGIRVRWLKPGKPIWSPALLLTMLLPRLAALDHGTKTKPRSLAGLAGMGLVLAVLIQGNLSPAVAASEDAPFYDLARSLRLGSLTRLEPVAAVTLTLSWFAASMLLVQTGKHLLEQAGLREKTALWLTAAAIGGGIVWNMNDLIQIAWIPAIICWILLPMMHFGKRSKKDEKSG